MKKERTLVLVGGPTASGKTRTAIKLAKHYDTVILNCDSRQFYQEMSIGTDKPSEVQLAEVQHYFVNNLSIQDTYTVGDYEKEALELLDKLFQSHQYVIMSGGSGLFMKAVYEGLNSFPAIQETVKVQVEDLYREKGLLGLQQELQLLDPVYYNKVDLNNHRRLIRAIEVSLSAGLPYSQFIDQAKPERSFSTVKIALQRERAELYHRINSRVDRMIENGLEEEAKSLYPYRNLRALQTLGYQEFFDFFESKLSSQEETVDKIKQNSRRYAKRQLTWFRNAGNWEHLHPDDWEKIIR